jgi:hypothetical protein
VLLPFYYLLKVNKSVNMGNVQLGAAGYLFYHFFWGVSQFVQLSSTVGKKLKTVVLTAASSTELLLMNFFLSAENKADINAHRKLY